MKLKMVNLVIACVLYYHSNAQQTTGIQLKTSSTTLMQYYVSLPENWSPAKKWPIVVIAEEAEKAFKDNTLRFIKARGNMPFIIVSPIIVTNGNYGRRNAAVYPYSSQTWDQIDAMTDCKFDIEGVMSVVNDVAKAFNGDSQFYLTGFEAGAHLVWAMVFEHPEALKAAAPVAGNYIGRCVNTFSAHPSKTNLPIRAFVGGADKDWGPQGRAYYQWQNARKLAITNGYKNITESIIAGKGHQPLPDETLAYFYSLIK
jgi:predicted peptidase